MELFVPRSGNLRVVPVRFIRGTGGSVEISSALADIDNRGALGPSFGSHVGVAVGNTVHVGVERVGVPNDLPLFAHASNDSFTIEGSNRLAPEEQATVQIRGRDGGGESRTGFLEIRAQRADGPIVGKLNVEVFILRRVDLVLHRVRLTHGTGMSQTFDTIPSVDMVAVADLARQAWIHYGVDLHWEVRGTDVRVQHMWYVHVPSGPATELDRIYRENNQQYAVNVYFVRNINANNRPEGLGVGRSYLSAMGMQHIGILLTTTLDQTDVARGNGSLGSNLAHELGHFFSLRHVGNREPPHADATSYGLRNLMHNFEPTEPPVAWRAPQGSQGTSGTAPRGREHGYGELRHGALVTMKGIPGVPMDDQAHIVRRLLGTPNGAL